MSRHEPGDAPGPEEAAAPDQLPVAYVSVMADGQVRTFLSQGVYSTKDQLAILRGIGVGLAHLVDTMNDPAHALLVKAIPPLNGKAN